MQFRAAAAKLPATGMRRSLAWSGHPANLSSGRSAGQTTTEPRWTSWQAACDQLAAERAALALQADDLEASAAAAAGEAAAQRPDAAHAAAALENVRGKATVLNLLPGRCCVLYGLLASGLGRICQLV